MYIINTLSHDFSRAIWNKQALVNFSRNYLNLMLSSTKMVSIHFPLSRSRVSYLCSRNFFVSFHATNDSWEVITLENWLFSFFACYCPSNLTYPPPPRSMEHHRKCTENSAENTLSECGHVHAL